MEISDSTDPKTDMHAKPNPSTFTSKIHSFQTNQQIPILPITVTKTFPRPRSALDSTRPKPFKG